MSPTEFPLAQPFSELDREYALQGPGQFLFTGEDNLQIDTIGSVAGLVITVAGVMLTSKLELRPFSRSVVPTSDRTLGSTRISVDSGWLQHVRVIVTTGAPLYGQTWVGLRIARGTTANALVTGTITTGYVTANTDLFWPGQQPVNPLDGEGAPRRIAVISPAAGADWAFTVPTGARWELVAVLETFAAAIAVANRLARLIITDGTNNIVFVPAPAAITASQTALQSYQAGGGGPMTADNTVPGSIVYEAPLPNDVFLIGGWQVTSSTNGIQAADQYSAISLYVREWLEGN